jgi:HSP20 family protein
MFDKVTLSTTELEGFESEVERMVHAFFPHDHSRRGNAWRPPTDVYETDQAVIVQVEIAGMSPDNIEISYSERLLTIRGRREDPHPKLVYHCMEIPYGEFISEVWLPGSYIHDQIEARYENGFLHISLPKEKKMTIPIPIKKNNE